MKNNKLLTDYCKYRLGIQIHINNNKIIITTTVVRRIRGLSSKGLRVYGERIPETESGGTKMAAPEVGTRARRAPDIPSLESIELLPFYKYSNIQL